LISFLKRDGVPDDEAAEGAADALLVYFPNPSRFGRTTARLLTYAGKIAKQKAVDRMRSRQSRLASEKE
jgi:DNA-directed RNA polymerase specialized sigma24 family protein